MEQFRERTHLGRKLLVWLLLAATVFSLIPAAVFALDINGATGGIGGSAGRVGGTRMLIVVFV